jgi:AcrR family transcriptional regulator
MSAAIRRKKHKQELRGVILEAAREIFGREGYESFSMRKLARKIEYSPGSIYLHFKNKEELFTCLVDESFARLLESLRPHTNGAAAADPVAELAKGLRTYVEFGIRNPNDYRFAFLIRPPAAKRAYQVHPAFDALRYMVGRCVAEQRFREVDVETISQVLWAAAHGVTSLLIQRPSFPWVSKNKLIAEVINNAMYGLLAGQESSQGTGVAHAHVSHG